MSKSVDFTSHKQILATAASLQFDAFKDGAEQAPIVLIESDTDDILGELFDFSKTHNTLEVFVGVINVALWIAALKKVVSKSDETILNAAVIEGALRSFQTDASDFTNKQIIDFGKEILTNMTIIAHEMMKQ